MSNNKELFAWVVLGRDGFYIGLPTELGARSYAKQMLHDQTEHGPFTVKMMRLKNYEE